MVTLRGWVGALLVGGVLLAASAAAPASAQDDDPYGSTTTTTAPPRSEATIELTSEAGPGGAEVGVFACGYASDDDVDGSITFDGHSVASGLVVNADGCLTVEGGAGRSHGEPPMSIRIPEGSRPGQHRVCAVVAGYETPCTKYRVRQHGHTEVRGTSISREGPRLLGVTFPRTDVYVALLVAIGVALLIVGRSLLNGSRRRREAERSALEASRRHRVSQ